MTVGQFHADPSPYPSGSVIPWTSYAGFIPDGWFLCDGNNGTPDLRDTFVRCVPDGSTDPGATGGENSISLSESQLPQHSHSGSTDNIGNHRHRRDRTGANDNDDDPFTTFGGELTNTLSAGLHSHNADTDVAGGGESVDNRPEHVEYIFIKKA